MKSPAEYFDKLRRNWKTEYTVAFFCTLLMGFFIHFPIMLSDIPNHDGLDSVYFDQNMITSGRWFLTIACGISSYFNLPWLISILAMLYLGATSVLLAELLQLKSKVTICVISGLLVSFPALASSFAYVYTLDGYMLALLLAVGSVLITKKYKYGFVAGCVMLGCSMGIYQAYLPICILLCMYLALQSLLSGETWKKKLQPILRLVLMGVLGMVFYFVALFVLLFLQGKHLDTYQGISGQGAVTGGLLSSIKAVYVDFIAFTLKGNVLCNNIFSMLAMGLLVVAVVAVFVLFATKQKLWKKPLFYAVTVLVLLAVPMAMNYILIVSGNVNYHLIMRYQWVFLLILAMAFLDKQGQSLGEWAILVCGVCLIFNYALTDNIGYSNLEKKYEKTYAYCVRLLDRIEQTPGYYQGIPVAMIGVVGEDSYPVTDISFDVTSHMIGLNGDWLLYTGDNYGLFMKHYLGATLNILDTSYMEDIYYSREYQEMDSFPGPNSTKVINGILYVHTENIDKTLHFSE